jgi:hypothetical protein
MPNNNLTYVPSEKWYPQITRDVKGLVLGQICAAQMIGWGAIGNYLGVCDVLTPYLFMQLVLFPFNGALLYRLGKGINGFRHRDKSIPATKAIRMARRRAKAEHKLWKKKRNSHRSADSIADPVIRELVSSASAMESKYFSAREYFGASPLPEEFYLQRGDNISAYAGYVDRPVRASDSMPLEGRTGVNELLGSNIGDQRPRYEVSAANAQEYMNSLPSVRARKLMQSHPGMTFDQALLKVLERKDSTVWDEEESDWYGDYAGGASAQELTPPRTPRPSPRTVWDDACRRFAASSEKLTAYETDIEAVYFTKPLLRDVTEKATAAFYDAFGEAQLLLHDSFDADRDDADELFRMVTKAERAWDAANANAERKAAQNIVIGGRTLSEDQVRELNTAKRALARVLDPASSPAEAAKAWSLVQTTVDTLRLRPSESLDANLVLALPSALRELTA